MAKQTWNNPIDKTVDWGGDATTGNLPVSGEMVQRFIKESLNGKAGLFHYDTTNNRYLVFTDADARDEYLLDPTKTELIIGTFDAPFNYSAEISLTSAAYNAVFLGSTGNYIDFTFDIKNKQGAPTGENVTVTYTFIRNATRVVVKETRKFGDVVHFNVDKYLGEGTNTIMVGVTGQTSLAATTVAITYQVVNLVLTDETDISKAYNLSAGPQVMEVPFTVSGYGTKVVEWYLDGAMLDFVKAEDEVVDVTATRTKFITLSNLQQGRHTLQIRAFTVVNGENFYTDTLYRDILVYTGANTKPIVGVAVTIPRAYGVLGTNDAVAIYNMVQYIPYTLRFATYSPTNASSTDVTITFDGEVKGVIGSANGIENEFLLTSSTSGNKTFVLQAGGESYLIATNVAKTNMNLQEITDSLVLNFDATRKSNNSSDRDTWSYGDYTGTLTGFNWNNTSGWVYGRLEMNAGAEFAIDIAPLAGTPTNTGKTIEIEWSTKNVTNDDAIICDLRNEAGVGILISATKVSMRSADGVVVETEYKSDENVRVGFVINRSSGTTNQRLSFIYANGIVSRGEKWAVTDSYASDAQIRFVATDEAELSLKAIRIYNTALTSDQMLNNYTLYRDTVAEMMEVYDRNDVYEDGTSTFSPDKMMGRLPVMIVTGDIPTLENTSDKDTQIVVDIDYYNMQDTSKSFRMEGAAMRPQGTSSMGYPKKNFRIYTEKIDGTVLYDADGNVVENKLYSFKDGAQPVNCWCLKADYAESSGTHNTGIARLWNEALFNAQVDGEYKLRTGAQKAAISAGYPYDVRTTIDGFPILLFYRPKANDDLIFIGKYNFNNDKSTESVFGFKGIPNFNNSKMQCWEVLNNGNALALFTTVEGFDKGWSEAFESRYPDTKTPYTGDLKAFCEWMTSVSQSDFATQKWEHLNVYMMAAYWCYLMRHAAADQFVKNAMFTSEDGQHFYYILYDNDTINGLINTGHLRIKPTDDRNTVDESGSHVFAGYDSRLWNMLENDEEFISIVSAVDNALYSAGISYANTIKIFDEEQADKWVERVYNQDAQYKYVGPYVERGVDNLFMLQGKRDLHRRWWLAKRFSIYDAKYVSGEYKSQNIEIKCLDETPAGLKFKITSGYPLDYGYGINNVPREFGVYLNSGESHTFETKETVFRGDPIRIYGAPHLAGLDLSLISDRLAVVTLDKIYNESLGTKMTKLVVGNAKKVNLALAEISGLKQAMALEYLDIQGMTKMTSIDLSNHKYFKTLKAFGSGVSSVTFAKGAPVRRLELPSSMRILSLEQLHYLTSENTVLENASSLAGMTVLSCPSISNDFTFVWNWIENKAVSDNATSLIMDNINWNNVKGSQLARLANIALNDGTVSLKGKVMLTEITEAQGKTLLKVFGENVFNVNSEFYVDAPLAVSIEGPEEILEGSETTYEARVFPSVNGTMTYSLINGRKGDVINPITGKVTFAENGENTSNVTVRATFVSPDENETAVNEIITRVVKRTYPEGLSIEGSGNLLENANFSWNTTTPQDEINGEYTQEWILSGGVASHYVLTNNGKSCVVSKKSTPDDTTNGILTINLKKKIDGSLVASASVNLQHAITWPSDLTVNGVQNPCENPEYAWETTSPYTGIIVEEWSLSNSLKTFASIAETTSGRCLLSISNEPIEVVNGTLTITLKKAYNNSVILSATKNIALQKIIRPSSLNINGDSTIYHKDSVYEYALEVLPSNVNVTYSTTWSVSNSTNVEIASSTNTSCKIKVLKETTTSNVSFTLTAKVTTNDGEVTVTKSKTITLAKVVRPTSLNFSSGDSEVRFEGNYNYAVTPNMTPTNVSVTYGSVILSGEAFTQGKVSLVSHNNGAIVIAVKGESTSDITFTITQNATVSNGGGTISGSKTVTLKSVIRPTMVAISGNSSIKGGESSIFTAVISPSNVNVDVTYEWQYQGSSNGSIKTTSNNTCEIATNAPEVDESFTLTCTASDGKVTKTASVSGTIKKRPNFISATYDVTSTSSATQLLYSSYNVSNIEYMEVDGVQVTKATSYTFSSLGKHVVRFTLKTLSSSFWSVKALTKIDFSECNGSIFTTFQRTFNTCSGLTTIIWGECKFPNVTSLASIFYQCTNLTSIDLTPFEGAPITSIASAFDNCPNLTSIDLTPLKGAPITSIASAFGNCTNLTSIDLTPLTGAPITSIASAFGYSNLTSIDLTPLTGAPITSIASAFDNCPNLTSIDLTPLKGAPITTIGSAFYRCKNLTSIDLTPLTGAPITTIGYTFSMCSNLTSIDLTPLKGAPITTIDHAFSACSSLTSIDLTPLKDAPITTIDTAFQGCKNLTSIDLTPLTGAPITDMYAAFSGCSGLTSIDLTPFEGTKVTDMTNLFLDCSSLTSIDLTPLKGSSDSKLSSLLSGCDNLSTIYCGWKQAPACYKNTFGSSASSYTGRNNYDKGTNMLYVPSDSTGYDRGYWLDPLCNSTKCGFTLSATL